MIDKEIGLELLEDESNRLASEGKTPMYVVIDNQLEGIIAVADTVKESSKKAIEKLHLMSIEVAMLANEVCADYDFIKINLK
jgi:Cu+-exporting ATPase